MIAHAASPPAATTMSPLDKTLRRKLVRLVTGGFERGSTQAI